LLDSPWDAPPDSSTHVCRWEPAWRQPEPSWVARQARSAPQTAAHPVWRPSEHAHAHLQQSMLGFHAYSLAAGPPPVARMPQTVVHEARARVREVAKNAAAYRKLMQDLMVQVRPRQGTVRSRPCH
jgi:hypothetical protein